MSTVVELFQGYDKTRHGAARRKGMVTRFDNSIILVVQDPLSIQCGAVRGVGYFNIDFYCIVRKPIVFLC